MTAAQDTRDVQGRLARRSIDVSHDDANTLRRAALTLHRWAELECGDSNDYASWCISRDDDTGKPFMEWHPHNGASSVHPVADRESGALRRVAAVCERYGLSYYHQGDPRGASLYIGRDEMDGSNYSSVGVAVY